MRSIDLIILIVILISDINGETKLNNSYAKEDTNDRSSCSYCWKNHNYNVDYNVDSLYAERREGNLINKRHFREPNNNNDP
jgi:hypothetical protein